MKKHIIYLILLIITIQIVKAQVGIGTNTPNASSILEVSNATNKGVLFPQVEIISLFDNTKPVLNPTEGMVVFNKGAGQVQGYYTWKDNAWTLFADTYNSISDLVLLRNSDYTILGGLANNTFKNFNDANFTIFSNNIENTTYTAGTGLINIPAGAYTVSVQLIVNTPLETSTGGVGGTRTQTHHYTGKLIDPGTSIVYGSPNEVSVTSDGGGAKKHLVNMVFAFKTANSMSFLFSLAHSNTGTYQNGSGGSAPNNGQITIQVSYIHVQRSVLIN